MTCFDCFGLFWVVLGQFMSPFGLFLLVLGCFDVFCVVLSQFRSSFGSFGFVLIRFG